MYGLTSLGRKSHYPFVSNFDDLVDGFFNTTDTFKVDVEEKDAEYLITAEMPGVAKNEIDLEMNNQNLIIHLKKEEHIDEKKKNYIHKETHVSSQSRGIYLAHANGENINAKLDNGILSIKVQKAAKKDTSNKITIE